MEAIVILVLIVLLILIISGNNQNRSQLHRLEMQLGALNGQLGTLNGQVDKLYNRVEESGRYNFVAEKRPEPSPVPAPIPQPDVQRWAAKTAPPVEEAIEAPVAEAPVPVIPEAPPAIQEVPEDIVVEDEAVEQPIAPEVPLPPAPVPVAEKPPVLPPPPPQPPPPAKPDFFERNPDLEKFIGENLISKIGIAILVIGIGFFVKYSIDQNWIGPYGRVGIGMLCGGILVGLAHRLRNAYKAFSSVLVGGGLAVFYFSIALAYQDYHLFSQPLAFGIMVVITIFAIVLALLYDRQEVAVIALVGGFAVPFMVSNGSGNYVALFTYLLVLNTGLLIIAYRKAWRLLNGICFGATVLIFGAWLGTLEPAAPRSTYLGGLGFATAFYILFLGINLAHNVRERKKFIASDFGILLASNCLYFSAGLYLLYAANAAQYKGLFSAGLGVLNFALAAVLIRRRNVDTTILYLLVGITLTFVSLTAPLQFEGHSITLFWAAESVVLLWMFQQTRIRILQWGLLIVWVCSIVSLAMDWMAVYGGAVSLPVIANRGFMTTLFAAVCNVALYRLLLRDSVEAPFTFFERKDVLRVAGFAAILLSFAAGALEIGYQFSHRYPDAGLSGLYLHLYTVAVMLALYALWQRSVIRLQWGWLSALMGGCLLFYILSLPHVYGVQSVMLITGAHSGHFAAHWVTAALTAVVLYQIIRLLRTRDEAATFRPLITWPAAAFAVILISVEGSLLTNVIVYSGPESLSSIGDHYVRVGLPIIWGLCSFAFMWLGMKHKFRPLRIVSLTLFSITLLKLFAFDIQNLGAGGKIAAFISLGVLLLIVSFMYQRLKSLLIEDERKKDEAAE